jgi:hypothetical protein
MGLLGMAKSVIKISIPNRNSSPLQENLNFDIIFDKMFHSRDTIFKPLQYPSLSLINLTAECIN